MAPGRDHTTGRSHREESYHEASARARHDTRARGCPGVRRLDVEIRTRRQRRRPLERRRDDGDRGRPATRQQLRAAGHGARRRVRRRRRDRRRPRTVRRRAPGRLPGCVRRRRCRHCGQERPRRSRPRTGGVGEHRLRRVHGGDPHRGEDRRNRRRCGRRVGNAHAAGERSLRRRGSVRAEGSAGTGRVRADPAGCARLRRAGCTQRSG